MAAPNSANVIIPGKGAIFTAPVGSVPPDYTTINPTVTDPVWASIGHTSVDNMISLSKDGGDATSYDSWWETSIDVTRAANVWSIGVNALEMTKQTFDLAFNGTIDTTTLSGGYLVPSDIVATETALFVLAVEGAKRMGLYLPRVSISLGDAPSFDNAALFEIPLSGSILSHNGVVMEWFHKELAEPHTP